MKLTITVTTHPDEEGNTDYQVTATCRRELILSDVAHTRHTAADLVSDAIALAER